METFVELTADNAARMREEVLHYARQGGLEDLEKVRVWIREAVRTESHVAQLYRVLGLDLEGDICACLRAFERNPAHGAMASSYGLRMLWRVLLRRYALIHALSIDAVLRPHEKWVWTLFRWKDCCLPRLLIGVMLGYLVLGSSGDTVRVLWNAHTHSRWLIVLTTVPLVVVYAIAFTDVQRRIGRMRVGTVALRASGIVMLGLAYSMAGTIVHLWCGPKLGFEAPLAFAFLEGIIALLLAFVLQLFWQDQSIGDPL